MRGTPTISDAIAWSVTLESPDEPTVLGDRVVVGTRDEFGRALVAFDAGTEAWRVSLPGPARTVAVDGRVFAVSQARGDDRFVLAIDPATGERSWITRDASVVLGVADGVVLTGRPGTPSNVVQARDATTGEELWTADALSVYDHGSERTVYGTADADGRFRVVARGPRDGTRCWEHEPPGVFVDPEVAVTPERVALLAGNGTLVGLDRATGERAFREAFDGPIRTAGVVADGRIYYGDWSLLAQPQSPARLAAVDADGIRWERSVSGTAASPFAADGDLSVAVETADGRAAAVVGRDDGSTRWRARGDPLGRSRNRLYVARDGRLVALDSAGEPRWELSLPTTDPSGTLLPFDDPPGTAVRAYPDRLILLTDAGIVSRNAADGSERTRAVGFGGTVAALDVRRTLAALVVADRLFAVEL